MRDARVAIACAFFAVAAVVIVTAHDADRSQDPQQQQPPVFRGRTDIVQLDVSVLDKKRKPVHGLAASDFTVLEDGKPQAIVAVSEISAPDEFAVPVWHHAATPDVATNEVGDKRLYAIIVEGVSSAQPPARPPQPGLAPWSLPVRLGTLDRVETTNDILHAIVDHLGPGDIAAIINRSCSQPFTDDRDKLLTAID